MTSIIPIITMPLDINTSMVIEIKPVSEKERIEMASRPIDNVFNPSKEDVKRMRDDLRQRTHNRTLADRYAKVNNVPPLIF